jgi:hypothetical protein
MLTTTTASAVVLGSCNTQEACNEVAEPIVAGPGGGEQVAFVCDAIVTADPLTVTSTSVQCSLETLSGGTVWGSPIQNCISSHCDFSGTTPLVAQGAYKFCVQATWLPTGGAQLPWGPVVCSTGIV